MKKLIMAARSIFLATSVSILFAGYVNAEKVVIIPMGEDAASSAEIDDIQSRLTILENAAPGTESRITAIENIDIESRLNALEALSSANEGFINTMKSQITDLSKRVATLEGKAHVPSDIVAAFAATSCPPGWGAVESLEGRFVIGLTDGGTLWAAVGTPYTDRLRSQHNHRWSKFTSEAEWTSYNVGGAEEVIIDWENGMNTDGTGNYPLAVNSVPTVFYDSFYTSNAGTGPPYVQLLYCQKL